MTQKREKRYFSPEFKREILGKISRGEATPAELVQLHNLTVSMICSWRRQLREGDIDKALEKAPRVEKTGVDPRYVRHLEEKLREAHEKLGEMHLVVAALKKIQEGPRSTKGASSYIVSGMSSARSRRRAR